MKRAPIALVFCLALFFTGTAKAEDTAAKLKTAFTAQYVNLLSIKGKEEFKTYGFGPGFPRANKWMQTSMALRNLAEQANVPAIEHGAAALIELGQTYMEARRQGLKTAADFVRFEDAVYTLRLKVESTIAQ